MEIYNSNGIAVEIFSEYVTVKTITGKVIEMLASEWMDITEAIRKETEK